MQDPTGAAVCLVVLVTLCQTALPAAQPVYPSPAGHVNDFAGVLDEGSRKELETLLSTLEADTTAEVAIATVSTLDGIGVDEYATGMFNAWGVGQADKDNGVLILVAPSEREMRIEVGYGLEGVMPDGLAGSIIRNEFIPAFREGNYQAGIVAGVRRVAAIVRRGEHVTESQLRARARAEEDARAIVVPRWIVIALFALLVAGGGYMVGLGGASKVIGVLLVGAIVAGLGLTLAWLYSLSGFVTLMPVLAGTAWLGVRTSRSQRVKSRMRGQATREAGWVLSGDTATSGDSGSGSSNDSGDSFGGGSSGGGGASGSW